MITVKLTFEEAERKSSSVLAFVLLFVVKVIFVLKLNGHGLLAATEAFHVSFTLMPPWSTQAEN